mgnify:CR=1 FL=1
MGLITREAWMNNQFHSKFTSIILISMVGVCYLLLGTKVLADEIKYLERKLEYLIKKKVFSFNQFIDPLLKDIDRLKLAIILKEVLDKPRALKRSIR